MTGRNPRVAAPVGLRKKREAWPRPRLFSLWGTAEGTAGLGDVLVVAGGLPFGRTGYSILLAKPATEVDQPAARSTEWKLRPLIQAFAFHRAAAGGATYLY